MIERGEGGQIVNTASAAAFQPQKGLPAYSASKAAVLMLSECLRAEVLPYGIGVTAVCPGVIATNITRATRYVGVDEDEQQRLRDHVTRVYQRRNFTPEQVAAEIVDAIGADKPVAVVTPEAKVAHALSRFAPGAGAAACRMDALPRAERKLGEGVRAARGETDVHAAQTPSTGSGFTAGHHREGVRASRPERRSRCCAGSRPTASSSCSSARSPTRSAATRRTPPVPSRSCPPRTAATSSASSRALWAAHARLRSMTETETMPFKMTEEKLMRGQRWTLRCGEHDLDIEGRPDDAPRYQELLYEAGRVELAPDLSVEVASPEDVEHYAHLERTGTRPRSASRASRETKQTSRSRRLFRRRLA